MLQMTEKEKIDREIHGFLADLGIMEQRTDEFADQEDIEERFQDSLVKVIDKIEKNVLAQVKKGKTKVKV